MKKKLRPNPWGILRYCILFAVTLCVWNFFRSYLLFLALILMVCCPAASFLLLLAGRDMLKVRVLLPDRRVGRNTGFSFAVKIHNYSRYAVFTADVSYRCSNLFTGYSERRKQRLWAGPGGEAGTEQLMSSQYAGRVEVRIESFDIYDLLHLFCLRDSSRPDADVIVWPAFSDVEAEEIYECVDGFPRDNETKKRGTDYNPDYEIREYIPGDELKSIHWKLSAKQEQLMVRERLATGREKINVLLPLGGDRQHNDGLIESLYALCRLLIEKEYPIQLYWPGHGEILLERSVWEQGELENAIEEILSDSGLHPQEEAQRQLSAQHPGASYILVQTGEYKGAYIR